MGRSRFRSQGAPVAPSAPWPRQSRSRSTSPPWAPRTWPSPARWRTAGSAMPSCPRPPPPFWTTWPRVRLDRGAPSTISIWSSRSASKSPMTWTRPRPGTPRATPSPSVPWARQHRTFTTPPSPGRDLPTTWSPSNDSGANGKRDEAASRVPRQLGFRTNLLGPPAVIKERLRRYQAAGVTTLQIKPSGLGPDALDALGLLIDMVNEVNRASGPPPRRPVSPI